MNIKHEKSACCRAKIYKYGNKRRQCSVCKKTWTNWKKKRGRKSLRAKKQLIHRVLIEGHSLFSSGVSKSNISNAALSHRFKKAMTSYLDKLEPIKIPDNELILVCDALWLKFKKTRWTLYLGILKPVNSSSAIILEPIMHQGRENLDDWKKFMDNIPEYAKIRIKAMVSDGFRGHSGIAKNNNWLNQRCHFHLNALLQCRRGRRKNLPNSNLREDIYQTIITLLSIESDTTSLTSHLEEIIRKPECPGKLKMIATNFLNNIDHFRNYMNYPELNIPNTTNSVESLNRIVNERCRHIRTPKSYLLRVKTFLRAKERIICNSRNFQQN